MIQKSKTDANLGKLVNEHLIKVGLETPMTKTNLDLVSKRDIIEKSFADIMTALELDLTNDSLIETPKRVAKMYVDEIFYGLDYTNFPKATTVENDGIYSGMVTERNITCMSSCEHHFVTIDGYCHVSYIPKDKVLGLSKLNRVVDFFSRRPQIQERLTEQIYHALSFILGTEDVAVQIEATHYCVKSRGIKDQHSDTVTSKLGGAFMSGGNPRAEFLSAIK